MLVLARKEGERIVIGDNKLVVVTVTEIQKGLVRLGIEASADTPVNREEVYQKMLATGQLCPPQE